MTSHLEPLGYTANRASGTADGHRRLLAGGVALLLLAGGAAMLAPKWLHESAAPALSSGLPPLPVTVSAPLVRTMSNWTSFTGQFSAVEYVEMRAQVSGYLTQIHFTDGQIVHKGDLLFVIDPRPYEIALQQAQAQLLTASAGLDLANRQIARTARLQHDAFASTELLDQRVQQQRGAQATLEQAEAAMRSAQLNLEFTRITAPVSGRISMHRASTGNLIAASSTLLTTIVSLDPVHLDFDMSENDYLAYQRFLRSQHVGTGRPVDRTVEASLSDEPGWPRRGTLDFIDNQMDRGSGTIHARATLPNPDLFIAAGQFARLRLPTSMPAPTLLVPDEAVSTDQSRKLVMTVGPDGTVVPKLVELGPLSSDGLRVIRSGIVPSDRVIINGLMRARPGSKVASQPGHIPA